MNQFQIVLAAIALHNFIKLNQLSTHLYCPPSFIDHEDTSGNIRLGRWRDEINLPSSAIQKSKNIIGSNNASKNAFLLRDLLKEYFIKEGRIARQNKIK